MTVVERLLSIAIAALVNFATRVAPFLLFAHSHNGKSEISPFIEGLGKFLPPAIMALLVVYCFRNVNFLGGTHGLPELLAAGVTIEVHLWTRNMFLSLIVGTLTYVLLVNFVFA